MDKLKENIPHQHQIDSLPTCSQKTASIVDRRAVITGKIDLFHLIWVQGFIMHQWILIKRWHNNSKRKATKMMNSREQVVTKILCKRITAETTGKKWECQNIPTLHIYKAHNHLKFNQGYRRTRWNHRISLKCKRS